MQLLTQPICCQTDRGMQSCVNTDFDNGTRFTINWLSVPFCNRTGGVIRHTFIHTIVIMRAALNIIQDNPYFHPLRLFWRLLGCPSLKERGKLGLSLCRALSLFSEDSRWAHLQNIPWDLQIMHPSLQFLDFSYLTHREQDRGHLLQKVNKNEIRHGTDAAGDCADALKHKMRCLREDLITSGSEMAFKWQNRQITEAEMDGNTFLCIMHGVFCQMLSKSITAGHLCYWPM